MQWWLLIGDKPRQGKRQGQAATRPDPPSPGNAMAVKTTPKKAKHEKSKPNAPPVCATSTLSMATQNLFNMIAVSAVSGAVLLGLIAAKHF
jgi:hypothetical protein